MIKRLVNALFPDRKRAVIILLQPPGQTVRHFLTHDNEELFFLSKGQRVVTAAKLILIRGFRYIYPSTDIHTHDFKSFMQDGVEYHIAKFDSPVIPEAGVDGYQKLKDAGFSFVMIGDHPLAPLIAKAIG